MTTTLILLTPLLLLLVVGVFCFAGCGHLDPAADDETTTAPPSVPPGNPPPPPPPPTPKTYSSLVTDTTGLAGYWQLNELAGNVAVDSQKVKDGSNKPGPSQGVSLGQPGPFTAKEPTNQAVAFDGVQGYVEVPFEPKFNTAESLPWTVELWVKPDPAAGPVIQVLLSSHEITATTDRGYEIALVRTPGQAHQAVRARLFPGVPTQVTVQPTDGDPTAWRHVVMIYDVAPARSLTLLVNIVGSPPSRYKEQAVAPLKYQNTTGARGSTLRFAAGHQATSDPADFCAGRLDEVAVYNLAIAQKDIDAHFGAAL